MLIQDRVASLREPFYDVGACIDAARVLANITGEPQTIYLDLPRKRWHVMPAIPGFHPSERPHPEWDRAGGIYAPGEQRSGMQTDRDITPEKHTERACGIHPDTMMGAWRSEWEAFCGM